MEFAVSARALGLRPIHGTEVDLADGRHLTLLVQDAAGWSSLCRILTRAHSHTREKPGPPSQAFVELADVLEHAEGLICLSGCALRGVHDEFTLRRLLDAFGPDRLRIELQRPFLRDDRARNRRLERVARRLGVACVATGNVHAHARVRALLQDALVAVRLHTTLRRLGARAARQLQPRARLAGGDGEWVPRAPRRRWRRPCGWPSGCGSI